MGQYVWIVSWFPGSFPRHSRHLGVRFLCLPLSQKLVYRREAGPNSRTFMNLQYVSVRGSWLVGKQHCWLQYLGNCLGVVCPDYPPAGQHGTPQTLECRENWSSKGEFSAFMLRYVCVHVTHDCTNPRFALLFFQPLRRKCGGPLLCGAERQAVVQEAGFSSKNKEHGHKYVQVPYQHHPSGFP